MLECQEYQNILGEKTVKIKTTVKDWNRLVKTNLWDEVEQILCGSEEATEEKSRTSIETNYQDMTESEKNELIAYTAGMEANSNEKIERLRKRQTFLLMISLLDLILWLFILIVILLHK